MALSQISVDIDEADAVVLQENLTKTRTLISQISISLIKIKDGTSKSEQLLSPIVEKNRQLTVFKKNVDDSLLAVSNVQGIASEASIFEARLGEGIDNVRQYITAIHKAEDIMERLNDNNNGNGEYKGILENLHSTILDSQSKLQTHFKELLKPVSQPFDPQIYMNDRKPFPYIDDNKIKDLSQIMHFFQDNDKPIDQLYADNRIKYISDSLAFLVPFTKHTRKNDKVPYEKGSNGITNYTDALIGFIYNEYALLEDIFKEQDAINPVFKKIFKPTVETFQSIIQQISTSITKSLSNDGLLVFELLDSIKKVQVSLGEKIPENNQIIPSLSKLSNSLKDLARTLFQNLLEFSEQKVQAMQILPQDSGISEVTVEVMSKARKFAEYKEGALNVIEGLPAGSWIPQPKPQWIAVFSSVSQTTAVNESNPIELLSSFFSDVIDSLIVSLEIKANLSIKKKQSLGYFLITNITLVEQIISRSELGKILGPTGLTRVEKLKKRALNYFLGGWKQVASYLLDVNVVGKLSSKDREVIKEKFRNFNSEFDELIKSYKQYNITDPGLKKFLSKEISFISPLYHRFYDKHSSGDFTKHTEKYIKYNKAEFDRIIESLGR